MCIWKAWFYMDLVTEIQDTMLESQGQIWPQVFHLLCC